MCIGKYINALSPNLTLAPDNSSGQFNSLAVTDIGVIPPPPMFSCSPPSTLPPPPPPVGVSSQQADRTVVSVGPSNGYNGVVASVIAVGNDPDRNSPSVGTATPNGGGGHGQVDRDRQYNHMHAHQQQYIHGKKSRLFFLLLARIFVVKPSP